MQSYNFFSKNTQSFKGNLPKWVLCLVLLSASLQVYSQSERIVTIKKEANTIGLAIKAIEDQTGYRISYDSNLNVGRRIALPSTPMTINSILPLILGGTGYSYIIVNELIGIRYDSLSKPQTATASTTKPTFVQYGSVTGIVLETQSGLPVGDALVMLKGSVDVNLVTDSTGRFVAEWLTPGQYDIIVAHEEYISSLDMTNLSGSNLRGEVIINLTRKFVAGVSDTQVPTLLSPTDDLRLNNAIVRYTPPASTPVGNPKVAIKTNLILAATTSPNLAVEVRLSDKLTLDIPVSYNPWRFKNNKLFRHLLVQPELRYWTRGTFNGHFFGANLMYSFVNMGNIKMPLGLWSDLEDYRFEGNVFGAGVSYGYQWMLSKRFSMEATVGVGYAYADYDKYPYVECGKLIKHESKHYFGPTKFGLSLIYFIR